MRLAPTIRAALNIAKNASAARQHSRASRDGEISQTAVVGVVTEDSAGGGAFGNWCSPRFAVAARLLEGHDQPG